MSPQFCPDCGGQCNAEDSHCPECQFPLELEIVREAKAVRIPLDKEDRWNRIARLLQRNGLRIKPVEGASLASHQGWWALPSAGLIVFLLTLLFGGSLVDMIWEPPPPSAAVLDLTTPQAKAAEASGSETTSIKDISFLTDAFKPSAEQKEITQAQNIDLNAYIDQPIVDQREIEGHFRQSMVTISVLKRKQRGTLLSPGGFFVAATDLIQDAFRREVETVSVNRTIQEQVTYVVPMVSPSQGDEYEASLVMTSGQVGLSLLSAPFSSTLGFEYNYDRNLSAGVEVWVCRRVNDDYFAEKTRVLDVLPYNSEVNFWVVDSTIGSTHIGSPVFNIHGQMCGVLLNHAGQNAVVSLVTIRERAPLIFKNVK